MSEKKHSSSSRSERGESRRSHRSSGRTASESGASRHAGSDISIGPPPSYRTRAEPQDATGSNSGRPPSERQSEARARSSYNGSTSGVSKHDDMQPYSSSSTKQRKPSTPDDDDDLSVISFQGAKSSIKDRIGGMFGKSKKSSSSERLDGSSSYGSVPPWGNTAGSEAGSGQRRRRSTRVDDRLDRGMGRLDVVKEEDFEGSMVDQEPEELMKPSAPSASVQRWMDRVPLTEDAVASFNSKAQPGRKGAQSETPVSARRIMSQERTPMSIAPGESAFSTVEPSDLTPRPLPRRAQSTAPTYHTTQVPTRSEAPRNQAPRSQAPRSEAPSYRTVDPRREIPGPKTRYPEPDKKDSKEQDEIEAAIKESMKDLAITARFKGDVKKAETRSEADEWNEDEINAAIQQSMRDTVTSPRGNDITSYEKNSYLTSHKLEQDLAAQREKEDEEAARQRSDTARRRREDELNARIKKDAEEAARRRREAELEAGIRRDAEDRRKREEAELDARIKKDAEDAARRRRREVEDAARRRREAELEARIKKDAEHAARLRSEAEDAARRRREAEMEARIKKDAEEAARQRSEAEDAARRQREAEVEARIRRDAEDAARQRREVEDAARRRKEADMEARMRKDAEDAAHRRREAEDAARRRREADIEARMRKDAEDAARQRREAEVEARIKKDAEDAARRVQEMADAAARRQKEAEDLDRQRRDAEDAARRKRESDEADRRHEVRLREVKHAAKLEKQAIAEQEREAEHAAQMRELELAEKARQIASIARERDEAIARKARDEEIALQRRTAEEEERLAAERSQVEDEKRELEKKRIEAQYRTMERNTTGRLASGPVGDRSLVPYASTGISTYPQAPQSTVTTLATANHTPQGFYSSSAVIAHPVTVQSQVTVTQSALSPRERSVQPSSQPSFPQPASQTQQSSTSNEDIYRPPRRHGMIMPDTVTRVQQHYRFRRSLIERNVREGRRAPEQGREAIACLNRNEVADIDALSRRTEELDFPLMEALEADIELLDRLGGDTMAPPVPWSLSSESASHGNTHIGHLREHINRLLTQQGGNAMANLGSGSRLHNSGGMIPGGAVQFFYEEEYFFIG